jgi:hypothetical protein
MAITAIWRIIKPKQSKRKQILKKELLITNLLTGLLKFTAEKSNKISFMENQLSGCWISP